MKEYNNWYLSSTCASSFATMGIEVDLESIDDCRMLGLKHTYDDLEEKACDDVDDLLNDLDYCDFMTTWEQNGEWLDCHPGQQCHRGFVIVGKDIQDMRTDETMDDFRKRTEALLRKFFGEAVDDYTVRLIQDGYSELDTDADGSPYAMLGFAVNVHRLGEIGYGGEIGEDVASNLPGLVREMRDRYQEVDVFMAQEEGSEEVCIGLSRDYFQPGETLGEFIGRFLGMCRHDGVAIPDDCRLKWLTGFEQCECEKADA